MQMDRKFDGKTSSHPVISSFHYLHNLIASFLSIKDVQNKNKIKSVFKKNGKQNGSILVQ